MSFFAEENINHNSLAPDVLLIRGTGRECVDPPLNTNPGIISDIRFIEEKGKSVRFGLKPETVI